MFGSGGTVKLFLDFIFFTQTLWSGLSSADAFHIQLLDRCAQFQMVRIYY